MQSDDHHILTTFAERIRTIAPDALVWAFGSRARGDAHPESDLDLCVVIRHVDRGVRERIREVAWELGFEHERVLTTVILAEEDFEHGPISASGLVRNILREGVAA